jgi:hypothetical protein
VELPADDGGMTIFAAPPVHARLVLARVVLVSAAGLVAAGCSDPTLEEACADYCDAIAEADCPDTPADQCAAQCDQVEEQLDGKCVEEYTEAFDCASGETFECREGSAVVTSSGCVDEAFAVLECQGTITEE